MNTELLTKGTLAKEAAYKLVSVTTETKNKALEAIATALTVKADEIISANNADIENATTAIKAVAEAYPELKSNENYTTLMTELSMTENMIAEYRSNYNKQIKEYKRYVRKFPTRQFLGLLGYEEKEYEYLDYDAPTDAPQDLFKED